MHWRLAYPSEYLNAADLHDKETKVVIDRVELEMVPGPSGEKKEKPVVHFKGAKKRWPLPKTCAREIAKAYGNDTDAWKGKTIVLFPTTCQAFGQEAECVRVKW